MNELLLFVNSEASTASEFLPLMINKLSISFAIIFMLILMHKASTKKARE